MTTDATFATSFVASISLILVSEVGDKTFFVTSIMSAKSSALVVFLASTLAMSVMNIISIFLGVLATSINPVIIHYISIALFFVFGVRMIIDGMSMTEESELAEYHEAQKMLKAEDKAQKSTSPANFLLANSALFLKVFSLIFFAEWGDKSQLSTILLIGKGGYLGVAVGAICGYTICNALAVLGSKAILRIISVRKVTIFGGLVFILCATSKVLSKHSLS